MNGKIMLNGKAYSSSGRPSREITMAQWLALPDTKYTDGVVYYIKDIGGANQFPPLIYSDEEREIGVWRDGRPLYQKTVICTATQQLNNSSWTQIQWNNEPNNIYQLIDAELNAVDGVPNTVGNIRFLYDNNHICGASNVTSGNVIYSGQIVTFKYTKTTDTPGSGTWTTDGTYAKHYSTEEKVIGTWIDGKPLHEKLITFSSDVLVYSGQWVNLIQLSDYNISKIIELKLYNGEYTKPLSSYMSDVSDGYLKIYVYTNWSVKSMIIQYTKTTD